MKQDRRKVRENGEELSTHQIEFNFTHCMPGRFGRTFTGSTYHLIVYIFNIDLEDLDYGILLKTILSINFE